MTLGGFFFLSVARRYKNFKRFVYNYEAETLNGVNGATDNKSGPKVHCTVSPTARTPAVALNKKIKKKQNLNCGLCCTGRGRRAPDV